LSSVVRMRDVQPGDKEQLRLWRNSPAVVRNSISSEAITPEAHERWFANAMKDPTRRYWIITCNQADVGAMNLYNVDHTHRHAHLSIYLGSGAHQHRGIGVLAEFWLFDHAFRQLHLHKICGEVLAFNKEGLERHKWIGFREEGVLRQHVFRDGRFHDLYCVGMLDEEWEQRRPAIAPTICRLIARLRRGAAPGTAGPI
jgi:UDP-4-amino-4,6-dideoxy-N-acetyl-beta-L-altrosamine N-acetyltransferase